MRSNLILLAITLSLTWPVTSTAQDVASILQAMHDKQTERMEGVDTFMVDQSIMGQRAQIVNQRRTVKGVDGETYDVFQHRPLDADPCGFDESGMSDLTPEQYEQMADIMEMTGEGMAGEIEDGLEEAGLPRGLLASTGSDPWATFDPRGIMGSGAIMYRGVAEAKRQQAAEDAMPDTTFSDMELMASKAELVGKEMVDEREAFHLRADDMNLVQESDGNTFTIETLNMWIDTTEYVPLRMTMDGKATIDNELRPIMMEKRDLDYRRVPDSNMFESYRQVMTISGMMNAEQEAEMKKVQQEMADFEKQMAQMPAAQREMIMQQMGPQMGMMDSMSSGGGMQMETVVHEIIVNHCAKGRSETDMFTDAMKAMPGVGGAMVPPDSQSPEASPSVASGGGSSGGGSGTAVAAGAGAAAGAAAAYNLVTEDDDVEVRPYYVDEEGIGVLRYSEPAGRMFEYHLAINGLTDNPERPREVLVGSMGPYAGPDVAIFIGSLKMMDVPQEKIEIVLFEMEPYRPVVRFRPQLDPDKAESKADCGTMSATGACSNTVGTQ